MKAICLPLGNQSSFWAICSSRPSFFKWEFWDDLVQCVPNNSREPAEDTSILGGKSEGEALRNITNKRNLSDLHLKHYHMSTTHMKKRTTHLEIRVLPTAGPRWTETSTAHRGQPPSWRQRQWQWHSEKSNICQWRPGLKSVCVGVLTPRKKICCTEEACSIGKVCTNPLLRTVRSTSNHEMNSNKRHVTTPRLLLERIHEVRSLESSDSEQHTTKKSKKPSGDEQASETKNLWLLFEFMTSFATFDACFAGAPHPCEGFVFRSFLKFSKPTEFALEVHIFCMTPCDGPFLAIIFAWSNRGLRKLDCVIWFQFCVLAESHFSEDYLWTHNHVNVLFQKCH